MPQNDDGGTLDYVSPNLSGDEQDSLARYANRLRSEPITPRQWLKDNAHLDPTPEFRELLWSRYTDQNPPPQVPGFVIEDVLGEGGVGRVYLAQDQTLNRRIAIKELTETLRRRGNSADRFRSEAQILAKLEHPNIVKVYQFVVHEGREFIAMEYLNNGTLSERLTGTSNHLYEVLPAVIARLARAVNYAHGEKIIHRDLKPSNILFDNHNEPKLSDFGLAKDLSDPTDRSQGAILGTHHYMAPEQVAGKPVVPATDIWALGVVLFRIFAGKFPFDGQTVKELHESIRTSKPRELPPEVPAELRRICLKCLEKDTVSRYPCGNDLADDLENALVRENRGSFPPGRPRWLLAGAFGVALLIAAAVAVPAMLHRSSAHDFVTSTTMPEKLPGPTQSIAFTSDGNFGLAEVAGARIIVWDLKRGQLARSLEQGLAMDGMCGSVRASDDGHYIAALGTNSVMDKDTLSFFELFDAETLTKIPTRFLSGNGYGRSISFSPDGKRIALETFDRSALGSVLLGGSGKSHLTIIDVEPSKRKLITLPARMTCSAFSPDGNLVFTGSNKASICVWDLSLGTMSREIPVPDGGVDEIQISQDGSHIFTASIANESLSVYATSGACEKTIATASANPGRMTCAALNPLGIGTTGQRDGTVIYWNLNTGENRSFPHAAAEVSAVAITRDGRKTLAAYSDRSATCFEFPSPTK